MKPQRGLTLLELMMALAILAIVTSLALPSFGAQLERQRLKALAESLSADLAEARFEAARSGETLHVNLQPGAAWCWSVATASGCPCAAPAACQLKRVHGADHAGILLRTGGERSFTPSGQSARAGDGALLVSSRGEALLVDASPLGRATICSPRGKVAGYVAC